MNLQTEIFNNVIYAKRTAVCWGTQLINKEKYSEKTGCCELKIMYLVELISTLENYYCDNFSDLGTITPDYVCLSVVQAEDLLGKLKTLIGV